MGGKALLDMNFMLEILPKVMSGIPVSVAIAGIAFIFGTLIGFGVALVKIYKVPVLRQISIVYVSFMRGTPLIVQIFLSYYGVPLIIRYLNDVFSWNMDISSIPAIWFMYVSFSLNVGAYLSESIRAAILSVDNGQIEAAKSIGMTTSQALFRIIIPQAALVAVPNLGNTFIILLKDTSLAFAASVPEIIGNAKIAAARSSKFFEAYIMAALLYWVMCIILENVLRFIEKALRKHERGVSHD